MAAAATLKNLRLKDVVFHYTALQIQASGGRVLLGVEGVYTPGFSVRSKAMLTSHAEVAWITVFRCDSEN